MSSVKSLQSVIRFCKRQHIHKYQIYIEYDVDILDVISSIHECMDMEKYSNYEGIIQACIDHIKDTITMYKVEFSDIEHDTLSYDITVDIDTKNNCDIQVGVRDNKEYDSYASIEQTKNGSYVLFLHNSVSSSFE